MMITSITRFPLPAEAKREVVERELSEVAPLFQAVPGLVRKYFLLTRDGAVAGGVYLWKSLAEARAFSEGPLRSMVRDKFAVEPEITYFDTPVIVENLKPN